MKRPRIRNLRARCYYSSSSDSRMQTRTPRTALPRTAYLWFLSPHRIPHRRVTPSPTSSSASWAAWPVRSRQTGTKHIWEPPHRRSIHEDAGLREEMRDAWALVEARSSWTGVADEEDEAATSSRQIWVTASTRR
jgi:hypothetical protein